MASPRWRALAAGTRSDLRTLTAELGRLVGIPAYRPHPRDIELPGDQFGDDH